MTLTHGLKVIPFEIRKHTIEKQFSNCVSFILYNETEIKYFFKNFICLLILQQKSLIKGFFKNLLLKQ